MIKNKKEFTIKKDDNVVAAVEAVETLMKYGGMEEFLKFLVDVQSIAIHSTLDNTVSSINEQLLQGISYKCVDLAAFFSKLFRIEHSEKSNA